MLAFMLARTDRASLQPDAAAMKTLHRMRAGRIWLRRPVLPSLAADGLNPRFYALSPPGRRL